CGNAAQIYSCFNSQDNKAGMCSDFDKDDAPEGVIVGKDGKHSTQKWMVFPYRQKDLDAGYPIHEDWILRCKECPYKAQEPEAVTLKRREAEEAARWVRQYQDCGSLQEREAMLS